MSYTNETTHYGIPKPLGTDLTTPMDYNNAADAIDTAVWGAVQDAAQATSDAADAKTTANNAAGAVTTLEGTVTTLEGTVGTQGTAITNLGTEVSDVRADLSDAICAVKEPTATAAYAHAIGDYFWYNDTLYRTTSTIAVGDTIVPNTNCETVTITSEMLITRADGTPTTGFSGYFYSYKQGAHGIAETYMSITCAAGAVTQGLTVGNVAEGYRPRGTAYGTYTNQAGRIGYASIASNGDVKVYASSDVTLSEVTQIALSICYLA